MFLILARKLSWTDILVNLGVNTITLYMDLITIETALMKGDMEKIQTWLYMTGNINLISFYM